MRIIWTNDSLQFEFFLKVNSLTLLRFTTNELTTFDSKVTWIIKLIFFSIDFKNIGNKLEIYNMIRLRIRELYKFLKISLIRYGFV